MSTSSFQPVCLQDLKSAISRLIPGGVDSYTAAFTDSPMRNNLALLGLTSVLFYVAERGHNAKVNSIWDATIYCSTCLNVGYGDIFAKTNIGKMVGTLLMTIGPGLNSRVGDAPKAPADSDDQTQRKILETLKQILAELEEQKSLQAKSTA